MRLLCVCPMDHAGVAAGVAPHSAALLEGRDEHLLRPRQPESEKSVIIMSCPPSVSIDLTGPPSVRMYMTSH
jgi:hypothetical protein